MTVKECFEKYRSRMVAEGFIKAILCGLAVGLAVNAIVAFITWCISGFNGLWLSIGCGLGAWAVAAPLFYVFLFKPTVKQIAERVDKLGMEERAITMLELQNDGSIIAGLQREDTKVALNSVGSGSLKISLFGKLSTAAKVAAVAVMTVLLAGGVTMTTLTGLADKGVIGTPISGDEPVGVKVLDFGSVKYVAGEGGLLIGDEADQVVLDGESTVTVTAYAEYGYKFMRWSDQEPVYKEVKVNGWINTHMQTEVPQNPQRTDRFNADDNPEEEKVIIAIFEPYDDSEPGGDGEGGSGSGGGGGGKGSDDAPPSSTTGGSSYDGYDKASEEEANQIEDGKTYYRTKYEYYLAQAKKYLEEGKDVPSDLKAIIESYYEIIA